mgnify:CR=1 FL=1
MLWSAHGIRQVAGPAAGQDEHGIEAVLDGVADRLRALRSRSGRTLAEMSDRTGVSVSTLSRLESGLRRPTLDLLIRLAAAYNGGPGLVSKNLPAGSARPLDLWLESFPVRETRRYMQRVTGTWGIYRFLYGSERPVVGLPEVVTSSGAFARAPAKLPPS